MWDLPRVVAQLRRHPDVLHLTTSGQLAVVRDLAVMAASAHFGVPVIYHIRFGRVPELAGGRSREWRVLARAMRRAHTVLVIDADTERAVQDSLPDVRVVRVSNCVDTTNLPQVTEQAGGERTVMFLGWVIPTKGIEELVQAWAQLRPDGWRLLVVGPGKTEYQNQLLAKYGPKALEFSGEQPHDEAMRLLAAADVFVLPSYTEGFPNVVVEAMALGKPIVATRVGAIPEMLRDGGGILVDRQDVGGLARAMAQVMADSDLRLHLGTRARQRAVSEYSLESVFAQYLAVWRGAAGPESGRTCSPTRYC